jgi:ABC-type Fe3+/spermidine/putrescine transport system ATPase subunit
VLELPPEIVVENLTKKYGDKVALKDVSFQVEKGAFFVVIGPSPSGKSVLLRLLMGLEEPTSGSIYIDGRDMRGVPPYKRDVSLMFQNYALFPHMKVKDNIAFGLKMRGMPKNEIEKQVKEVVALMGLEGLENRYVRELSGGQQQRVAFARSLVVKPRILLLDEPMGNLDYKLQKKLEVELKLLHRRLGLTFVYVTHDQEQAMTLATRIMVMNQGMVEQVGSPEEVYLNPATVFVAKFFGEINMLPGEVKSIKQEYALVATSIGLLKGSPRGGALRGKVAYAVRPERLRIGLEAKGMDNQLKCSYLGELYRGSEVEYYTRCEDGTELKVLKTGKEAVKLNAKVGDQVLVGWRSSDAIVLPEENA